PMGSCQSERCQVCTDDSACTDPTNPVCITATGKCGPATQCMGIPPGMGCPVNANDLCCANGPQTICVAAKCCTNAECTAANTMCVAGRCVANPCVAPTDHVYYVDPTIQTDGVGSATCPFKRLGDAVAQLAAEAATPPVTVNVAAATVDS